MYNLLNSTQTCWRAVKINYLINQFVFRWFVCHLKPCNGGDPKSLVATVLNCSLVVNEFEFQSRYRIPFRIITQGKSMNPLIYPISVFNSITAFLLQGLIWH